MHDSGKTFGLALSGGGSRAIAFHLGCMRALNDRQLLSKISVISSVSGGSVICALWAYSDLEFDQFEKQVLGLLREGLTKGIVRHTLLSKETFKILSTVLSSGVFNAIAILLRLAGAIGSKVGWNGNIFQKAANMISNHLPRFASRSTAFERYLRKSIYGNMRMDGVVRRNLNVVINASELRTGTAFRYGSRETGCWKLGKIVGEAPLVSQAVAASAAFPVLLPAFDQILKMEKDGEESSHRVLLSDGGVYENLGISCLTPGQSKKHGTNVFECDFIFCCDAGQGQPDGYNLFYNWAGRMGAAVNSIFRRSNNQGYRLLHDLTKNNQLDGFILSYLGQLDSNFPVQPSALVTREQVMDYPTDFFAMSENNIHKISARGEQIMRSLIEHYHPYL